MTVINPSKIVPVLPRIKNPVAPNNSGVSQASNHRATIVAIPVAQSHASPFPRRGEALSDRDGDSIKELIRKATRIKPQATSIVTAAPRLTNVAAFSRNEAGGALLAVTDEMATIAAEIIAV